MKAASSNVETVFSGAGQLPPKLYAEILSNYTVLHHNLKYTWLDPKDDDVVKDYEALYGPDDDAGADSDLKTPPRTRERTRQRARQMRLSPTNYKLQTFVVE